MAAAEFFSPEEAEVGPVRQQHPGQAALRAVVGWLAFLLQILLQIVRGTPSSWAQLLSFLGIRHPLLSTSQAQPSPSVAFVQLPSEAPADASAPPPPPLKRLTVVLDLDETLVCAYESSSLPAALRAEAIEAGLHCFDMECISAEKASKLPSFYFYNPLKSRKLLMRYIVIKDAEGRQRVNHVTVFERPGLHEFLQRTSEFADLILFTAGLEGYAKPLVDRIDAHNRLRNRLYRPSTVTTEYREHVKDLSCLSKDFRRIVIVDNNPYSFLLQPLNGIPCLTFSAGQPVDDQLMGVIFPLLKHLSLQNDVRPALYETFHMPEWFQRHGIPQIDQAA
ncbi:CTD nuclear envelope phosphatase 1 homolog isoform X1 [Oryza brachyantha]|nr:CTD nuclear envelope phosphatase 1 homolog isoform X1 [Oryza brachyantha]